MRNIKDILISQKKKFKFEVGWVLMKELIGEGYILPFSSIERHHILLVNHVVIQYNPFDMSFVSASQRHSVLCPTPKRRSNSRIKRMELSNCPGF